MDGYIWCILFHGPEFINPKMNTILLHLFCVNNIGKPSPKMMANEIRANIGERKIRRNRLKSLDKVFMPLKGQLMITL